MTPLVSVVMSVRNGEKYLADTLESVLNQSFDDFEFIILDNGSTDSTPFILSKIQDPRVRVITQEDLGLAASLNKGVAESLGEFVARQDADDISRPDRLERQVKFLKENPTIGLLGTAGEIWSENQPTDRLLRHSLTDGEIAYDLLLNNPFIHTSVMFRKSIFVQTGGYTTDRERQPPEDYELWSRMMRVTCGANLHDPLVVYREVAGSMSREGANPFLVKLRQFVAENLAHYDGGTVKRIHRDFAAIVHPGDELRAEPPNYLSAIGLLDRVEEAIQQEGRGEKSAMYKAFRAHLEAQLDPRRQCISFVKRIVKRFLRKLKSWSPATAKK